MRKLITPSSAARPRSGKFLQTGTLALTAAAMLAAYGSPASAATVFDNGDALNSLISNADNWDNGLPVGQQGAIAINAVYDSSVTLTGYDVIHSAGNLGLSGTGGLPLDSSTWLMNGTATFSGRGLNLTNSSTFTVDVGAGDANFSANNRDISINSGSTLALSSGNLIGGRSLNVNAATFTINGGTVTFNTTAYVGTTGLGGDGILNMNAGTITADRLALRNGTAVNFGGSVSGSATFDDWGTGLYTNTGDRAQDNDFTINFLAGSQMSLSLGETARALDFTNNSISDPTSLAWAEALWGVDQLLYNGQSSTDLGLSWADATNSSIGLGGGEYFAFTSAGDFGGTLSLAVIPEPASLALLGLGGLLMLGRGRRLG